MDPRLQKILKLPNKQKVALLALILLAEGAGMFFGLHQPRLKELKQVRGKLDSLRVQVADTKKIADNLPRYKSEFVQLQKELESALTELPNQKEIPSLLTTITAAGKGAGLDFLIFKPKPEEPKDFYAAVPVDIAVAGSYYSVANFFVAVAKLPRIVNITNVAFPEIKSTGGRTMVKVTCLATTFRFLDQKEITKKETKNVKKGK